MDSELIDRVDIKSAAKRQKLFFYLGIGLYVFLVLKIILNAESFYSIGYWIDISVYLIIIFIIFKAYRITKLKATQFIEWNRTSIKYKLKNEQSLISITIDTIKNLKIGLDFIKIETSDKEFILNIEEFRDFKTIKRIKANFEELNINRMKI